MRWGNYDSVTGISRFVATEVPASLSLYANPVPVDQILPASLYRSSKPSWWGTMPWPAIGPGASGGEGRGGHARRGPAPWGHCRSPTDGERTLFFTADTGTRRPAAAAVKPP